MTDRQVRAAIERMPVLGRPAIRLVRAVRRSVGLGPPATPPRLVEGHPYRFRVNPAPAEVVAAWPDPPKVDDPIAAVDPAGSSGDPAGSPIAGEPAFDIELFEALNAEFAERPLVASPQEYDDDALLERARARLLAVHRSIDLSGRRVLEFGCGAGYEIWSLSHQFDSHGWGVDPTERRAWATLADERTTFVRADLAVDRPFEANFFDRVVSFAVFEHVRHPHAALAELYRVMKPGGLAWIKANLHRGPMASHRYRWINFPFPHLLFDDDVFREYCRRHDLPEEGAEWVNRLTWSEYERHFERIGFKIRMLRFTETPLDEAFYERFESVLGRYPRTDLSRDFFEVVLEKPARPT
ncbi:MAG: 2-polyprenyl-6-hydroxyphenyl methylase / 3-demethylubiquinone-9 3-methyltransferase [Chloroflexota bacterium]|nr:2-polyprenyl-6-hydroxyphenyl methylase / 3-demethylubiquinone-9 3-methyltransferase [Chloroflexota bacterium]